MVEGIRERVERFLGGCVEEELDAGVLWEEVENRL